jgi:Rhomboid-like protein
VKRSETRRRLDRGTREDGAPERLASWHRVRLADRLGVAVAYAVALAVGTALLHAQPRPTRDAWLDWASTNLANAPDHPLSTLVVSALFTDGEVRGWLVLSLVGLGALGWRLGAGYTLALVAAAHVLGTVLSEGILAVRIAAGAVPAGEAHIRDIGPSYVVVAALVAGLAYGPWAAKLPCAIGFAIVAPDLFGGLPHLEVSSVGHVGAITVALIGGAMFARSLRRAAAPAPAG